MNIVITGGAGYIGSMLCHILSNENWIPTYNAKIKVFDDLSFDQWVEVKEVISHPSITFYHEDILNWSDNLIKEINKANYIIPLAAIVGAPACDDQPELAKKLNHGWFKNLLKHLNGKQKIIFPNTNSGYGTTPLGTICTEETPTNPISLYGKTKKQTEDLLLTNYKNVICFRLATVFGLSFRTRLDLLVNNFVYNAVKTGHLDIFDGHFCRNFISVRDVCHAFMFAMEHWNKMKGNVYNLGTDTLNATKLEFAKKVQKLVPCSITEHDKQTDPDQRNYMVSNKKLYSLGFKPDDTDMTEEIIKLQKFCSYIQSTRNMLD